MTTLQNFSKTPRHLQKQDWLLLACALLGLLALTGLIYREGAAPARAAAIPDSPTKLSPILSLPSIQPQTQITAQNTISGLDVVVVFDISGTMEDQTICHDCWVRTSYNLPYPSNGYFNPLPYDKTLADNNPGTGNQSIPLSALCTVYPPQPFITGTLQYLTVEAELYSRNVGNWDLSARTPGQGFWTIQRGSKRSGNNNPPPGLGYNIQNGTSSAGEDNDQRNQAGDPTQQSSNVCRPNGANNQIDCTVGPGGGDNVCADDAGFTNPPNGNDIIRDCSAYIAARPFTTYGQMPGSTPSLNGAAYNFDCFSSNTLSGSCWSSSPFAALLGNSPSNVPWVEYDFTPTWDGTTYIWIRAIGGGAQAFTWAGPNPDQLQPDLNGGDVTNNITPWRKVIYWQVDNGIIDERKDNLNSDYANWPDDFGISYFQGPDTWRDNRAENGDWRWIKLGSTTTVSGTQYLLKLYQGSTGYKVDKLVFTNDSSGSTPEASASGTVPAALRQNATGSIATSTDYGNQLGPPASPGSATREACNVCNPAFGYTVNPNECNCKINANDTANGGYGSGLGCTQVNTFTNQLTNDLYSGLQPLRSAQEAVKNLANKLNPQCDQVGFVPFTASQDNMDAQWDAMRRTKLLCLNWAGNHLGNPARCFDPTLGTALSYSRIISSVERHWPESGTDIATGLREGLEELGVSTPGNSVNSNCTASLNDGQACDRGGAAKKVLILLTDGSPNTNPGSCNGSSGGRPDLWDGLIGTEDADFECTMYYAYLAAQNNVTLYTIGIGGGANNDLLTAVATGVDPRGDQPDVAMFAGVGGQFFAAAKPSDLGTIFDTIVAPSANCQFTPPSLTMTKTASPNPVAAGSILAYTITVTSTGTANSPGVVITDALDSNVSFASASDGGLYNAGVVTWNVGMMLPGQTLTRTLIVTVADSVATATLTNTAWVTSNLGSSHSNTISTTVSGLEQIWVLNNPITQGSNLLVHLENHLNVAGPYDIYLSDGVYLSKICEAVNTSPATHSAELACFISNITPPGLYTLFSTITGSNIPLASAPQQVEVIAGSIPQVVIDNGGGGNVAAVNSNITINLVAHPVSGQPFDLYFVNPVGPTELEIFTDVSAVPASLLIWQVPGSLLTPNNPCPAGGNTPCLIQSRDINGQVYAVGEFYLNSPEILLAGGNIVYAQGETIYTLLHRHTPGLSYDLKFSDGISNTIWLGRTEITDNNGDTLTPTGWIVPAGWPNGVYTLTSHPAVGGTPRDPASMTSTNQIGSLSNIQINAPAICANPLAESSFETVPPVKWTGIGTQGVQIASGNSHTGNFGLLADTLRGSVNFPFFYQSFSVPASLITSTPSIRLNLFKNVVNEVNGPDPNDRFYVVLATGPTLASPQVTEPMLVATGVGADSYSPANWQELNLMLPAASGINLADYAGQDLYLQFYNTSNTQAGCPPICNDTQFYFDDINLTICVPVAPPQTAAPAQVQPGNVFTYTITVANSGTAAATGVVVTDLLDNKLTFVSASNGGQHNNGLITWAVGGLPVGQIITRTLAVTVGNVVSGTLLSNIVRVTSTEGLSYTTVVTTRVSTLAAPPASSSYLPLILKQK